MKNYCRFTKNDLLSLQGFLEIFRLEFSQYFAGVGGHNMEHLTFVVVAFTLKKFNLKSGTWERHVQMFDEEEITRLGIVFCFTDFNSRRTQRGCHLPKLGDLI